MKIKVGQIWYHHSDPGLMYKITDIIGHAFDSNLYSVKADQLDVNEKVIFRNVGLGYVRADLVARWDGWQIKYPPNSFTRISQKFLRKRMRDQMAAEIFAHHLTEEKLSEPDKDMWLGFPSINGLSAEQNLERTLQDMRYFQERLIQSLNLPSNWSHDP